MEDEVERMGEIKRARRMTPIDIAYKCVVVTAVIADYCVNSVEPPPPPPIEMRPDLPFLVKPAIRTSWMDDTMYYRFIVRFPIG